MAWRQYHENSVTDPYEIAAVTSGSNSNFMSPCGKISLRTRHLAH